MGAEAQHESSGSSAPDSSGGGNAPAMSWTQPARQNSGQAQLFESQGSQASPPAPAPVHEAAPQPAAAPQQAAAPQPAAAPPAGSEPPKQVVWSSAPVTETWHSDARRDE
jgi:hypothetical protein